MSWFWLTVVLVSCVGALCAANDLAEYGMSAYSRMKVRLMYGLTAVAVLAGVPLVALAYQRIDFAYGKFDGPTWVAFILAVFVDAILAHDVGKAYLKLRSSRHSLPIRREENLSR